jgi:hypothetical protein
MEVSKYAVRSSPVSRAIKMEKNGSGISHASLSKILDRL